MESKVCYIEKLGVFGCTVFGGQGSWVAVGGFKGVAIYVKGKANFFFFFERTNLVIGTIFIL